MEAHEIEIVRLQIEEAIRLLRESREAEVLAMIDSILAGMKEPPLRISGRATMEENIWRGLKSATKSITTDLLRPVALDLTTLLRRFEPHKLTPAMIEARKKLLKGLQERGVEWAGEALNRLTGSTEKENQSPE